MSQPHSDTLLSPSPFTLFHQLPPPPPNRITVYNYVIHSCTQSFGLFRYQINYLVPKEAERFLLYIHRPYQISNISLHNKTRSVPISFICKKRRLLWFGNAARRQPECPSRRALAIAIDASDIRRPRGWLSPCPLE